MGESGEDGLPKAGKRLLYCRQERYAEAEPLLQRALTIIEKTCGPEHVDTALALDALAQLYQDQERYAEAEPLKRRAKTIRANVPKKSE